MIDKKMRLFCHDLNNKLAVALAALENLLEETKECPRAQGCHDQSLKYLRKSLNSIYKLNGELTRELLEHHAVTLSLLSINETHQKFLKEYKEKLKVEYDLDLTIDASREDAFFYICESFMEDIFLHIISNAKKAQATKIFINHELSDKTVSVHFKDNGQGMSQNQVNSLGFGSSLSDGDNGVDLLREFAAKSGGTVEFKSIEGIGTEVILTLKRGIKE